MRLIVLRAAGALLLTLAAACGTDTTTPGTTPPPPPPSLQDGLWTASGSTGAILRLDSTQLRDTGPRDPVTAFTTTSAWLYPRVAVAFDGDGDLWVASQADSVLLAFAPGALTSSGPRAATRVIVSTGGSLRAPTGLAFDAHHRLWVVNAGSGRVVRFDPAQLDAGGAQQPAVVLTLPGNPATLAFDAAGSLWVCDNQFHTIARYPASELQASGTPHETLRLTGANSLVNPSGIAFDAAGNLWVANTGNRDLVAFSPAQQAGAGSVAPHIVISSNGGSLNNPVGLAFDDGGNLWVVGRTGTLSKFAPASLGASGAPVPMAQLGIRNHSLFWSLAFWPHPLGSPN